MADDKDKKPPSRHLRNPFESAPGTPPKKDGTQAALEFLRSRNLPKPDDDAPSDPSPPSKADALSELAEQGGRIFGAGAREATALAGKFARQAQTKARELSAEDNVKKAVADARASLGSIGLDRRRAQNAIDLAIRFVRQNWLGLTVFVVGAVILYYLTLASYTENGTGRSVQQNNTLFAAAIGRNLWSTIYATGLGFLIGFAPIMLFKKHADVALALVGLVVLGFALNPHYGAAMQFIAGGFAVLVGGGVALWLYGNQDTPPNTFGSSRWATRQDVIDTKLAAPKGIRLGVYDDGSAEPILMRYAGDRHLLTCAPTRSGKGTTAIIPNLLTYEGSMLVIDPKGENALISAKQRIKMGHKVYLLDPWDLAASKLGMKASCFDPVRWLVSNKPDFTENAMILADALIQRTPNTNDPFWEEEARALIYGFLMYLAADDNERDNATLGRLRSILTSKSEDLKTILERMEVNNDPNIRAAAARFKSKENKLKSGILAGAQAQTHFLETPAIQQSLAKSDFQFEELKTGKVTIYLILPADRLHTYGRWLRLLVQQAITVNARNIDVQPKQPIVFLLDEMAALGYLASVEQAYGLMAGFGMQLWGIVQDFSQLKRLYGDAWETFIGNSGVLQYFGSRDNTTASYFSNLCGETTVWSLSSSFSGQGGRSDSRAATGRKLALPDELMTLRHDRQLLLVGNAMPIIGRRISWLDDPVLKELGVDLHASRKG